METYLVGGSVRDSLMGLPAKDRDWCVVGATPEQMIEQGFLPVGRDFPVFLHPETREEYALARGADGKPHIDTSIEEDLSRRDLSINAMAIDAQGRLIDPHGGRQDLADRHLRHVGEAFAHDPLRVLRVARFAARLPEFTLAGETRALMNILGPQLPALPPERIWGEVHKAMAAVAPRRFIELLRESDCLRHLLPELDHLFGVPQPVEYHPEIDTGLHCLLVVDAAARLTDDPAVRLAALLHDLGKGLTPEQEWPRHLRHETAGVPLVRALCARIGAPTEYGELAELVCRLHLRAHRSLEMRPHKLMILLEDIGAYRHPARLARFLLACQADMQGRQGHEHAPYPQAQLLNLAYQASRDVRGQQFLDQGHGPGPHIGELVRQQRSRQIRRAVAAFRAAG